MALVYHDHCRRHPILAVLAAIMFVGSLRFAFERSNEAPSGRRMLATRTKKKRHKSKNPKSVTSHEAAVAGLDADGNIHTRQDECVEIMTTAHMKKAAHKWQTWGESNWGSATSIQKARWETLDCVHLLSLYKQKVLGYGDVLPEDVIQSTLSLTEQRLQLEMTKAVLAHLVHAGVRFSPAFGTLLSVMRNGVGVLPWDDDIDLIVDDREGDFKQKVTKGLKELSKSAVKGPRNGLQDAWELPGGWVLYNKNHGTPWRCHPKGTGFPMVDLMAFQKKPGAPEVNWINPKIMGGGHVHRFEKPDAWYGSMTKTMAVPYSIDIPELITLPVPDNALALILEDYGEEGLTYCQLSFTHDKLCDDGSKKSCRKNMINRLARLKFPCVLLPDSLHGWTLANEVREGGDIVSL